MKTFEISSKITKNGRRKFKVIMCEVFDESVIDKENQVGTKYNINGITWVDSYVDKKLDTIPGTFLRVEFLNDERTEICGHGDTGVEDGFPTFEDAVCIGTFTKGYIDKFKEDDGEHEYLIGEGEIDALCYNNFVKKLEKDIEDGNPPFGSVEILKSDGNDGIGYLYGYVDKGRIPVDFQFSGYALLGVEPADSAARIIELNNTQTGDVQEMTEVEIKNLISSTILEMNNHQNEVNACKDEMNKCKDEMNKCKEDCETKITEANELVAAANATAEQFKQALDQCKEELGQKYAEIDQLYEQIKELQEMLAKAQIKERIGEMNEKLAMFTDEEKQYAKAELEAFNKDPINSEINSVVSKIWEEIGKKAKQQASDIAHEQNSADYDDIFGEISDTGDSDDDPSIF